MLAAIPFVFLLTSIAVTEAAPVTTPTTLQSYNGWSSQGCYVDAVDSRKLPVLMSTSGGGSAMTVESCIDACSAAGYSIAGLEWAQECYCGNALPPAPATDGRCNMACTGNGSEYCGGSNGLNVYQYSSGGTTTTQTPSGSGYRAYTYSNCYVDSVSSRVLPNAMYIVGAMTIDKCVDACNAGGYNYAGVEWGQECYCGSSIPTTVATDDRCNMPCSGNGIEICGGSNGIDVYQSKGLTYGPSHQQAFNGWSFSGCYEDSVGNRVLPTQTATNSGNVMTIETCLSACSSLGYKFAGLEYAGECWCGSSLPSTLATDGRCNMLCNGNSLETCGGPNGLDVYQYAS